MKALKFTKKPDTWNGMTNEYHFEDDMFKGYIYQCFPYKDWDYVINIPDLDNKELTRGPQNGTCKTVRQAKELVIKLVALAHKANTPGNLWILKGLMLGLIDETEMQHLKD